MFSYAQRIRGLEVSLTLTCDYSLEYHNMDCGELSCFSSRITCDASLVNITHTCQLSSFIFWQEGTAAHESTPRLTVLQKEQHVLHHTFLH